MVQYQYLRIGLNLAKVHFNKNMASATRIIKQDLATENELTFLIGKSITKDSSYFNVSIDSVHKASSHFLNDFLTDRLASKGVTTDFVYTLISRDSATYLRAPGVFEAKDKTNIYPIALEGYLPHLMGQNLILELQFKDLNNYFLFQLNGLTIPSLIFIFTIIIVVIWVLKSFYWQRKVITTTNEFINNLTHELKTPVFSIGLATKILEENSNEDQKPILKVMREQVERLKQHVEKVLELGTLEENKNYFNLTEIDFKPNLEKIAREFSTLATIENVDFQYKLPTDSLFLKAEAVHLENAIINLLDNAKKYARSPEVKLFVSVKERKLLIAIVDNGEGFDEKYKNLIFQKYYRIIEGDLYKVKGYGLGLSYVKKVIQKHKGKIIVKSEIGKGTTMTIQLPLLNYEKVHSKNKTANQ